MKSHLGVSVQVSVLGSVGVRRNGADVELGPRLRRLLAALAASNRSVVSSDRLVDIVWDGEPPDGADKSLRTYVTRLRQSLDSDRDDLIVFRQPGYAIDLRPDELDSEVFDAEVERALQHLRTADTSTAGELLEVAIGRWRGPAYAGFAEEEWARPESVRLEERRREAQEALIEARLADGFVEQAVGDAQALVEAEPYRERPRALLMRALYASGRQAEALRVFAAYRRFLAEETGLDPSEEIAELEGRIAQGDPGLGGPSQELRGYELGERIGEGAFAVVRRAVQPGIGRDVAVKIIRAELADRADFIRRFEFEAQTVARLEHPNVVPLYDYWREPGAAYLVMRWLRGGSVEEALRARGPYSREQTMRLVDDVAGALETAHRAGVVHRDVRPANLLLDMEGTTYLADFGIALPAATSDDLPIVSPAYAAPEVLRGEPAGVPADVLSLGVTVFEVLTGRLPFADSTERAEVIRRQLTEPLPPVVATRTDLPPQVDDVLARATAKVAGDRYANVAAFVADLGAALGGVRRTGDEVVIAPRPDAENPYVGLHAFDEQDADRFHGREALVAELVDELERRPMVVVVGPSGSGKSSVVRAGLLPAIRRGAVPGSEQWFVTTMVPGSDPIDALEAALLRVAVNPPATLREQLAEPGGLLRAIRRVLPDDRARILLVVDQLEELFTQVRDPDERDRFLTELAAAITHPASPLRVVATLRADHYDTPLRHPAMADLVTDGTVTVRPMSPDELERATTLPARSVGVQLEPALAAELVAGISNRPSALPLLQFSLTELFDRRISNTMLLSTHHELGGLTGALAARADRIIDDGGPDDEAEVRRIFGRLVTLGEGVEDTRRRALRSEFGDGERTAWLLDAYTTARLLTTDRDPTTREPTIEVAHEALLRDWPRLRRWLDEDRNDLRTLHAIGVATDAWIAAGRDAGELARSGRLETATDLAARHPDWLNDTETEWLSASTDAADADAAAQAEAIEHDRRQNRRLRGLLTAAVILLVVALGAAAGALILRNRAVDSENAARAAEEDADIERLIALSAAEIDTAPDRAILLALEANRRRNDIATQTAIHRAIAKEPRLVGWFPEPLGEVGETRFSADGTVGVTAAFASGEVTWFDVATGDALGEVFTAPSGITTVAISGQGDVAGVATTGRTVSFVDRTGALIGTPVVFDGPIGRIGLDGAGARAVIVVRKDVGSEVTIVDVEGGSVLATYDPVSDEETEVVWAEMTADGTRAVLSVSPADLSFEPFESIDVIEAATADLIERHVMTELGFISAMSVDGNERVITGHDDGSVAITPLHGSGTNVHFGAHRSQVTDVVGSGDLVLSAARGSLRFWTAHGEPIEEPLELPAEVIDMVVRNDGSVAAAERSSGHVLIDPRRGALVRATRPVDCYSQLMPELAYFDQPGPDFESVVLTDLATGEVAREIVVSDVLPNGVTTAPHYAPDGSWIVLIDRPAARFVLAEVDGDASTVVNAAELYEALFGEQDVAGLFAPRPEPGGRRFFYMETSGDRTRAAWVDAQTGQIDVGPVDVDVFGPAYLLEDGRVLVGGEESVVSILPADLASAPVIIPGTDSMRALHQDPSTGAVLIAGTAGQVGVLDPTDLTVNFLEGAEGAIWGGAFSPDGSRVAVVSPESGVHIFDRQSGSLLGVPMDLGEVDECMSGGLRWEPDGSGVWAVASRAPTLFSADPDEWRRTACDIVHRDLTHNEWRTFVSPTSEPVPACAGQ